MDFTITNTQVYGLNNAIIKSGNPTRTTISRQQGIIESDIKRAKTLGNAKQGSGHDNFLKGITVQFDLIAPLYFWKQIQRYHFLEFISSQSTMYCITKFDIKKQCNKYVFTDVIERITNLVEEYNKQEIKDEELWYTIISNIPSGFNLGASLSTNYQQLKTIYNQRKGHKLKKEWGVFCEWCKELPMFEELCLGKTNL